MGDGEKKTVVEEKKDGNSDMKEDLSKLRENTEKVKKKEIRCRSEYSLNTLNKKYFNNDKMTKVLLDRLINYVADGDLPEDLTISYEGFMKDCNSNFAKGTVRVLKSKLKSRGVFIDDEGFFEKEFLLEFMNYYRSLMGEDFVVVQIKKGCNFVEPIEITHSFERKVVDMALNTNDCHEFKVPDGVQGENEVDYSESFLYFVNASVESESTKYFYPYKIVAKCDRGHENEFYFSDVKLLSNDRIDNKRCMELVKKDGDEDAGMKMCGHKLFYDGNLTKKIPAYRYTLLVGEEEVVVDSLVRITERDVVAGIFHYHPNNTKAAQTFLVAHRPADFRYKKYEFMDVGGDNRIVQLMNMVKQNIFDGTGIKIDDVEIPLIVDICSSFALRKLGIKLNTIMIGDGGVGKTFALKNCNFTLNNNAYYIPHGNFSKAGLSGSSVQGIGGKFMKVKGVLSNADSVLLDEYTHLNGEEFSVLKTCISEGGADNAKHGNKFSSSYKSRFVCVGNVTVDMNVKLSNYFLRPFFNRIACRQGSYNVADDEFYIDSYIEMNDFSINEDLKKKAINYLFGIGLNHLTGLQCPDSERFAFIFLLRDKRWSSMNFAGEKEDDYCVETDTIALRKILYNSWFNEYFDECHEKVGDKIYVSTELKERRRELGDKYYLKSMFSKNRAKKYFSTLCKTMAYLNQRNYLTDSDLDVIDNILNCSFQLIHVSELKCGKLKKEAVVVKKTEKDMAMDFVKVGREVTVAAYLQHCSSNNIDGDSALKFLEDAKSKSDVFEKAGKLIYGG